MGLRSISVMTGLVMKLECTCETPSFLNIVLYIKSRWDLKFLNRMLRYGLENNKGVCEKFSYNSFRELNNLTKLRSITQEVKRSLIIPRYT